MNCIALRLLRVALGTHGRVCVIASLMGGWLRDAEYAKAAGRAAMLAYKEV